MISGDELRALLRALDDPDHVERPAGFDDSTRRAELRRLGDRLDRDFGCRCDVDGVGLEQMEDSALLGRITIPAASTRTGAELVVVISRFARMSLVTVENSGAHDDAEMALLSTLADATTIAAALEDLGWFWTRDCEG